MATERIVVTATGKSLLAYALKNGKLFEEAQKPVWVGWGYGRSGEGVVNEIVEGLASDIQLVNEGGKDYGTENERNAASAEEYETTTTNHTNDTLKVETTIEAKGGSRVIAECGLFCGKIAPKKESYTSTLSAEISAIATTIKLEAATAASVEGTYAQIGSEIVKIGAESGGAKKEYAITRAQFGTTGAIAKKGETVTIGVFPGPYWKGTTAPSEAKQNSQILFAKATLGSTIALNEKDKITWTWKIQFS